MLISTNGQDTALVKMPVSEDDVTVVLPYRGVIHVNLKHGTPLVYARHDLSDLQGDIDALITLCIYRYSKGESNEKT
jgi:hypothetical protein